MTVVVTAARGTARVWLPPISPDDPTTIFPAGLMDAVAAYPTARLVGFESGSWLFWVNHHQMMVAEFEDYETTGGLIARWVATTAARWLASFETFSQTLITHLRH